MPCFFTLFKTEPSLAVSKTILTIHNKFVFHAILNDKHMKSAKIMSLRDGGGGGEEVGFSA